MRYTYLPVKDASIYEEFSSRNTGYDEILEVGKSQYGTYAIRSMLQFDVTAISTSIADGTISSGSEFDLMLFIARADDLRIGQTVELYEVSRSWVEGSGYFYQNVNVPYTSSRTSVGGYTENDGTTWVNRQSGSLWSTTGSEYYGSPARSGTVANPIVDITFDVTTFVRDWISGSVTNNGLVLKFPTTDELDDTNVGNIRFFSRQTHTVYAPLLVSKWNSQTYATGTMSASLNSNVTVAPKNLSRKYRATDVVRVDLSVREKYPVKTFDTVFSNWAGTQRLPATSYFSIVDVQSNAVVVPYSDSSRVDCDGTTSYIKFYVGGMYPGRFYKVLIKVVDTDYTQVFDSGQYFSIEQV